MWALQDSLLAGVKKTIYLRSTHRLYKHAFNTLVKVSSFRLPFKALQLHPIRVNKH